MYALGFRFLCRGVLDPREFAELCGGFRGLWKCGEGGSCSGLWKGIEGCGGVWGMVNGCIRLRSLWKDVEAGSYSFGGTGRGFESPYSAIVSCCRVEDVQGIQCATEIRLRRRPVQLRQRLAQPHSRDNWGGRGL